MDKRSDAHRSDGASKENDMVDEKAKDNVGSWRATTRRTQRTYVTPKPLKINMTDFVAMFEKAGFKLETPMEGGRVLGVSVVVRNDKLEPCVLAFDPDLILRIIVECGGQDEQAALAQADRASIKPPDAVD